VYGGRDVEVRVGGRGRGVGVATPFVGMGGAECEGVLRSTS